MVCLACGIVQLYVTGLGVPDSIDAAATWSTQCMAASSYFAAVNAATGVSPALTSDDGLVVQSVLFPASTTAPCIKDSSSTNLPAVTVGGITATVLYAGWVPDSVAGLYQINVRIPSNTSTFLNADGSAATLGGSAVALPVVVTTPGSVSSQTSGVNLSVIRRLNMTLSGTVSTGSATYSVAAGAIGATGAAASGGTAVGSGYTYAVTTGSLPAGLSLNAATGAITGTPTTPAAASTIVITATDTVLGWKGTVSITFTITA